MRVLSSAGGGSSRRPVRRLAVPLVVALLASGLAGCDFGPEDENIVYLEEILYRFPFSADSLSVGRPFTVTSTGQENMASRLAARGFSPEEVVGARVRSGFAEVLFPLQQPIGFIDDLTLSLVSGAAAAQEAAAETTFPSGSTDVAEITPTEGADLAAFVDDTGVRGRLRLVVNELRPGTTYEVAVQFLLEVEVRGF